MCIMLEKTLTVLDFDDAMELAKNDPEAFEQYRLDAIEALITSVTWKNQQNLRRLQWRIEQERKRAPDPAAACVKIYQMMWDSFIGNYGFVDVICNGNYPSRNADDNTHKAKLFSFSDIRKQTKNSE